MTNGEYLTEVVIGCFLSFVAIFLGAYCYKKDFAPQEDLTQRFNWQVLGWIVCCGFVYATNLSLVAKSACN